MPQRTVLKDPVATSDAKGGHIRSRCAQTVTASPPICHDGRDLTPEEADRDLDAITWSMRLASVKRYFHQRFWEQETTEAEFAARVEAKPRLESVADHSWHVADTVMILAPRFPELRLDRAVMLAILHDKMEISIGDLSPVGRDGTGSRTHAFNAEARQRKTEAERRAVENYLLRLNSEAAMLQRNLFEELLEERSPEARFVKAVDKLQALVYVVEKKAGKMSDAHLKFTMQYSSKVLKWPDFAIHLARLRERLFFDIAKHRNVEVSTVREIALGGQDTLFDISMP